MRLARTSRTTEAGCGLPGWVAPSNSTLRALVRPFNGVRSPFPGSARQLRPARAPGAGSPFPPSRSPAPPRGPAQFRPVPPPLAGATIPGSPRPRLPRAARCAGWLSSSVSSPLGLLGGPDGRSAPESAFCILIISGLARVTPWANSLYHQSASGGSKHACVRAQRWAPPARVPPAACAGWGAAWGPALSPPRTPDRLDPRWLGALKLGA